MSFFGNDDVVAILRNENSYLKQRIGDLEAHYHELALSLIQKPTTEKTSSTPADKPPVKHEIFKNSDETTANCSCGWSFHSDDPGELQQEISLHYRQSVVSRGRKSWPQVKSAAESAALQIAPGEV